MPSTYCPSRSFYDLFSHCFHLPELSLPSETVFHSQNIAVVSYSLPTNSGAFLVVLFWSLLGLGDPTWPFCGNSGILDHGFFFPFLNKHRKFFFYLLFQLSFAIWCLVWLHLCLLNDFKRRPSLHMGRRRRLCWFLPYVHLFIYYDFCNLTSTDPFRQSLHSSLETHFFVCSAGSFRENIFLQCPLPFSIAQYGFYVGPKWMVLKVLLFEQRKLISSGWFYGMRPGSGSFSPFVNSVNSDKFYIHSGPEFIHLRSKGGG